MFNYASTNVTLDLKFVFLRNEKKSINAIDFKFVSSKNIACILLIHFYYVCQTGFEALKKPIDFQVCTNKMKCKSKTCSLVFKREME